MENLDMFSVFFNVLFVFVLFLRAASVAYMIWSIKTHRFAKNNCITVSGLFYLSYRARLTFIWRSLPNSVERKYLTIIPRARMGYESIAHSALGLMGY